MNNAHNKRMKVATKMSDRDQITKQKLRKKYDNDNKNQPILWFCASCEVYIQSIHTQMCCCEFDMRDFIHNIKHGQ